MQLRYDNLRGLLIPVGIVCATVALIGLDPWLLHVYQLIAPSGEFVRQLAEAAEYVLEPSIVLIGIIIYALLIRSERLRRAGLLVGLMLTQAILVSIMKKVFSRMRPADLVSQFGFYGPQWRGEHNSFPSGHATAAFALSTMLAAWHPRARWVFHAAALLVALSRIHLQRHFFSDCFIGACLGYWLARTFLYYYPSRSAQAAESAASQTSAD